MNELYTESIEYTDLSIKQRINASINYFNDCLKNYLIGLLSSQLLVIHQSIAEFISLLAPSTPDNGETWACARIRRR